MDDYLERNLEKLNNNPEIVELKKTRPAAIITTNYDKVMETVFGINWSGFIIRKCCRWCG